MRTIEGYIGVYLLGKSNNILYKVQYKAGDKYCYFAYRDSNTYHLGRLSDFTTTKLSKVLYNASN